MHITFSHVDVHMKDLDNVLSRTNLDWYLDIEESVQASGKGLSKSHVPDLRKRMTEQQCDHQHGTDAQSVSVSSSPIMVGVSFDLPLAVQHMIPQDVQHMIPQDVQPDQIPRCPVVAYGLDHNILFQPDSLFPYPRSGSSSVIIVVTKLFRELMNVPPMHPGPPLRYLYVHQAAASTSQSWRESGTLPTAWAKSQITNIP